MINPHDQEEMDQENQKKIETECGVHLKPARFLDPKADVVFKKIFCEHPDLLKSFLNGVLPLDSLIETVEYLPSEQTPRIPALKNTIVDVKCKDQKGHIFIVEMQMNWSAHFTKRLLFGVSKAFVQQIMKGEDYESLCPVYGLAIINDTFDMESAEWFHHYRTVNIKDTSKVLPGLELIFLELPKFKPQTLEHRKMGVLWLRFLKEINEKVVDVPEEFMQNPDICKAMELAQESGYSVGELESYDKFWDAVRVEKTIQNDARREGIAEGVAKGIAKEKEKIAKAALEQGLAISVIQAITGLLEEEIKSLGNSKKK